MSNLFNVVLTGELLKGQSIMQAANGLSKLFKIAPIQAQQMLARAPLVIKKNLEEDTAVRFVQAMYKSGFGAQIEDQKPIKHGHAPMFVGHNEDDDDGPSSVTRITPVLVEQSRLAESLDNDLVIPAPAAEFGSSGLVGAPGEAEQIEATEQLFLQAGHSQDPSNSVPASWVESSDEYASGLPNTNNSEIDLIEDAARAQAAELLPVAEVVVVDEQEPLFASSPELADTARAVAETDHDKPQAADGLEGESRELIFVEEVYSDLQPTPERLVQEGPSEEGPAASDVEIDAEFDEAPSENSVADWFLAEISSQRVIEIGQEPNDVVIETVFDPFASWDSNATDTATPAADLSYYPPSAEDQSSERDEPDSSVDNEQTMLAELSPQLQPTGEYTSTSLEGQALDAEVIPKATAEMPLAAEDETTSAAEDDSIVSNNENLADISEDEATTDDEDLALVAEVERAVESEEAHYLEITVSDVQWVEPVAQWQSVAELAESRSLQQGFAAMDKLSGKSILSEALTEQALLAEQHVAGEPPVYPVSVEINESAIATMGAEQPESDWEDAVEISPALSERLAQIAEASKGSLENPRVGDMREEAHFDESSDAADSVLLFEEADVTEISSADWDDWHVNDEKNSEATTAFNPLLDFDLVEPDWRNMPLKLAFDAVHGNHHDRLSTANEDELIAFLDGQNEQLMGPSVDVQASTVPQAQTPEENKADSDDTAEYTQSEPAQAEPGLVNLANGAKQTLADGEWSHEISVQANCGFLEVVIPAGGELHVAAAASVTMGLSLHEQLNAGSSVRAWLLAKGFVMNTYEAPEAAGSVGITAITHGMVCAIDASEFPVMVQRSAYLASTDGVHLNADMGRLNPVVSASKWIHCSGGGELWLNAQGLWEMVEVDGCYRVNSRYLMAYSKSLELTAPPLAGLKSYLTSGDGVECRLTGRGVVWVQTEAARAPVIWQ